MKKNANLIFWILMFIGIGFSVRVNKKPHPLVKGIGYVLSLSNSLVVCYEIS